MKFKVKIVSSLSHPYLVSRSQDETVPAWKRRDEGFSEVFVKETLDWARERELDILVSRGWRGDAFAFAFKTEEEANFFLLGRQSYLSE